MLLEIFGTGYVQDFKWMIVNKRTYEIRKKIFTKEGLIDNSNL